MQKNDAEASLRHLYGLVVDMHERGDDNETISRTIATLGLTQADAERLVEQIIDSYYQGVNLYEKPGFLESNPSVRLMAYFLVGVALVLGGSIALSFLLGLISYLFDFIGLGEFGDILVRLGEEVAGGLMTLLGVAACTQTRSLSMFIGCIVGTVLYWTWFVLTVI